MPRRRYAYLLMTDQVGYQALDPPGTKSVRDNYMRLPSDRNDLPKNVEVEKGTLVELDPLCIPGDQVDIVSIDRPEVKATVPMRVNDNSNVHMI